MDLATLSGVPRADGSPLNATVGFDFSTAATIDYFSTAATIDHTTTSDEEGQD